MNFETFEARATELWEEIPESYKEGIDGLVISRDAMPHAGLRNVYTLGECRTETYPSDFGGPETTRSVVVLYFGSFWRLSKLDRSFDWEEEIWETLTHELQHHLESLASEDALEAMDYAVDENIKRLDGEPFDPFFYRSGEMQGPGIYRVDRDFFIEVEVREPAPEEVEFLWHGARYRVPTPDAPGDVCFLRVEAGLEEPGPGEVNVVVVRRPGWRARLFGWASRRPLDVREAEAVAQPAD